MDVPEDLAVPCGSSNKSYWRSAKKAAIHMALNNGFFASLGLISLRDPWVEIHYPLGSACAEPLVRHSAQGVVGMES